MRLAFEEARASLREGNSGFGAVLVADGQVVAHAHDCERTEQDPTAHAELTVIRIGSRLQGGRLEGCTLVATHEPCPMCATALVWAGISELVYAVSIEEAIAQGRRRIALSCRELFERAGADVTVHAGVMRDLCAVLYDQAVRAEISRLRGAGRRELGRLADELAERRLRWCEHNPSLVPDGSDDPLSAAYQLFLTKLGIPSEEAPVVQRGEYELVIHSRNFCPTLEACKLLGLDTRVVCRAVTERPADVLVKQVDRRLSFTRNYARLRPHADVCEEIITVEPHADSSAGRPRARSVLTVSPPRRS